MKRGKLSLVLGASAAVLLAGPALLAANAGNSADDVAMHSTPVATKKPVITVYHSPSCGCCSKWVEHLQQAGFEVKTTKQDDLTHIKHQRHVPAAMQSCHTAVVDGYTIEGHVPADVIEKLLRERPQVAGIAVPGMPMGSPGMEHGDHREPYQVYTFDAAGRTAVFARR